jgi:hypothetical protein
VVLAGAKEDQDIVGENATKGQTIPNIDITNAVIPLERLGTCTAVTLKSIRDPALASGSKYLSQGRTGVTRGWEDESGILHGDRLQAQVVLNEMVGATGRVELGGGILTGLGTLIIPVADQRCNKEEAASQHDEEASALSHGALPNLMWGLRFGSLADGVKEQRDAADNARTEVEQKEIAERNTSTPTAGGKKVDGNYKRPREEDEGSEIVWDTVLPLPGVAENPEGHAGQKEQRGESGCDRWSARR